MQSLVSQLNRGVTSAKTVDLVISPVNMTFSGAPLGSYFIKHDLGYQASGVVLCFSTPNVNQPLLFSLSAVQPITFKSEASVTLYPLYQIGTPTVLTGGTFRFLVW
jgi:hypothetical protein